MVLKFFKCQLHLLPLVATAGILHLLLLCAPVAFINEGYRSATDPRILDFLFVVSVWCFVESMTSAASARLPTKTHGPQHLPHVIGLSLLMAFWISLTDTALSVSKPFGSAAMATLPVSPGMAVPGI